LRNLRVERARAGLTLGELSKRSGVNPGTISAIERGVQAPQATTLQRLADALKVDVGLLLEDLGERQPRPLARSQLREVEGSWLSERKDRPVLVDFEEWARRVAELDVFGLDEEERVLTEVTETLEKEITELGRSESLREDPAPNWQLRRRLRRMLRREHGRKVRALRRYREHLIREGYERLDSLEALQFLQQADKVG
jgi:transcriptional regulator with XRE-family HTH domain